jgi:hypothetical protein
MGRFGFHVIVTPKARKDTEIKMEVTRHKRRWRDQRRTQIKFATVEI